MLSEEFVFDLMAIALTGWEEFLDYILDNNIPENSKFLPHVWFECSNSIQRTTNACRAFHSKCYSYFYSSHPHIFQFIEVLKLFQTDLCLNTKKKDNRKNILN